MSFNDATCECEKTGHSPFGVVVDDERLIRVIISPLHVENGSGKPKPSAFQTDDLMHRGLSLLRQNFLDEAELSRQGTKLCNENPERSVHGYMVGTAKAVRDLRDRNGGKAFCIVDDNIDDQQMHATLKRSLDQDKVQIKELRAELMRIFSPILRTTAETV